MYGYIAIQYYTYYFNGEGESVREGENEFTATLGCDF